MEMVLPETLPLWTSIPFFLLLLLIVTGPLFFSHFWHKYYKHISIFIGILVLNYFLFVKHDLHTPAETLQEYISFVALLSSLFIVAGGIYIHADLNPSPLRNVAFLLMGAVASNIIGTTGAAMLLVRPFIRLNKYKIRPYHMIFFIFIVCNVGGLLTPIGDPPLFLGYLKGVPFFFTLKYLAPYWALGILSLSFIFYIIDSRNSDNQMAYEIETTNEVVIIGKRNIFWLALVVGAVFLDPNIYEWLPYISYHGVKISFVREIIQFGSAFICYRLSDRTAINSNEFSFEPILEVVFLFFGIFFAMMPALKQVGYFANTPEGSNMLTLDFLYWASGFLSSFLDNAPTYLNFLSAAMAKYNLNIGEVEDVRQFATSDDTILYLIVISIASVFFGAFTYIGNGPNFMVRSIAESSGVKMPSFIGYITRFVIPYLFPILLIVYLIVCY